MNLKTAGNILGFLWFVTCLIAGLIIMEIGFNAFPEYMAAGIGLYFIALLGVLLAGRLLMMKILFMCVK